MNRFSINHVSTAINNGIAREHDLCAYYGITRTLHDHSAYDKDSDIVAAGLNISVKASGFSLMSGSLCEGLEDFDGIWNLYESRVHSDHFAYVTSEYEVYMMNIAEFKSFIYMFGALERESQKNGGKVKIKCRKESKKMLAWLDSNMKS